MSRPEERPDLEGAGPCRCDLERVFELADKEVQGGLDLGGEREVRKHLALCSGCRDLYERELALNASLASLPGKAPASSSRSIHRGVAMALPTRSLRSRALWGLLAGALLLAAFVSLETNGAAHPMILAMSMLDACWGSVAGSMEVAYAVLRAAGPVMFLALSAGALVDALIGLVILCISRGRRTREI